MVPNTIVMASISNSLARKKKTHSNGILWLRESKVNSKHFRILEYCYGFDENMQFLLISFQFLIHLIFYYAN